MLARALLLLTATALIAPGAASAGDGLESFQTPSRHIACMYQHLPHGRADLRCDVDQVARPVKRPKSCELDYGSAFGLSTTGRAQRLCVGDTVRDPAAKILKYGATRRYGPFTCTSRTTGLRCTTRAGHGFELSRQRQKLF
ncbi:MAG TPA: DUF6636 domain-containing protein [Baekduia sp.]|nr:DUF6636 domain-containing protein [Baekduia sp.]